METFRPRWLTLLPKCALSGAKVLCRSSATHAREIHHMSSSSKVKPGSVDDGDEIHGESARTFGRKHPTEAPSARPGQGLGSGERRFEGIDAYCGRHSSRLEASTAR